MEAVPAGQLSNGDSLVAVRAESVTWYMQLILLSRTELSLARECDIVMMRDFIISIVCCCWSRFS